jgi:flavin-dependent dehydrogenase
MASLLRGFPALQARLEGVPAASPVMSTGPLHRLARRRTGDGVLLIGDAGGYLDACTGEGISLALAQALALEKTVAPMLCKSRGRIGREHLRGYEGACRRITRPYLQATQALLFLGRHPRLLDRFIRALQHRPDLLQYVFSAQMGQVSFWPGWSRLLQLGIGLVNARPQAAGRLA